MFTNMLLLTLALAAPGVPEPSIDAPTVEPPGGALRIVVNIPSYRLEVYDGDEKIRSYPVTVGMPKHSTPTGGFSMTRIEWNPWWTPPDSKWAEGKDVTSPGPRNPMGRVKMQFDTYLYVHGTALTKQLGTASSHGCVRLSNKNALELARLIATRTGALSDDAISGLENNSKATRSVRLPVAIPVLIRYARTERTDDGRTVKQKDIYGLGDRDDSAIAGEVEVVDASAADANGADASAADTSEPAVAAVTPEVDSAEPAVVEVSEPIAH